jgi:hypothetical protein
MLPAEWLTDPLNEVIHRDSIETIAALVVEQSWLAGIVILCPQKTYSCEINLAL